MLIATPKWLPRQVPEQYSRRAVNKSLFKGRILILRFDCNHSYSAGMENIKLILKNLSQKRELNSVFTCYRIIKIWQDAVGPRIARHSHPKRLQNNTLWVEVDSSVWMQQLHFMEEQMKEKLNQMMGSSMIEKIRFKLGEMSFSCDTTSEKEPPPEWQEIAIDNSTLKIIEKEIAVLNDEELKAELRNLLQKQARLETYRGKKGKE